MKVQEVSICAFYTIWNFGGIAMHSSIFEISHSPIPVERRARAGNLPDWFYEQVCHYAENPGPGRRETAIQALSNVLGPHCVRERDRLLLSPKIRESFFRRSYLCFKAAAEALAQTEYPVFAGISPSAAFPLALSGLNESYEEPHGIYIYSTEHGTLVTLERWLRHAELSQPFYLGGTIYYHC